MKNEIQKLTDTIDLMRDEFMRIKACPSEKWAKPEIDGLCDRAIKQINQHVPVIVQRDRAEAKALELRVALLTILDAVDYTAGNCRTNDMVSAALDRVLITNARTALSSPNA